VYQNHSSLQLVSVAGVRTGVELLTEQCGGWYSRYATVIETHNVRLDHLTWQKTGNSLAQLAHAETNATSSWMMHLQVNAACGCGMATRNYTYTWIVNPPVSSMFAILSCICVSTVECGTRCNPYASAFNIGNTLCDCWICLGKVATVYMWGGQM